MTPIADIFFVNLLEILGFETKDIEKLKSYVCGDLSFEDIGGLLKSKDFNRIPSYDEGELGEIFWELWSQGQTAMAERTVRLFYALGETDFLVYFFKNNKHLEVKVPALASMEFLVRDLLTWFSEQGGNLELYYLKTHVLELFQQIFQTRPNFLTEISEDEATPIWGKLFLCSWLITKNPEYFQKSLSFLEEVLVIWVTEKVFAQESIGPEQLTLLKCYITGENVPKKGGKRSIGGFIRGKFAGIWPVSGSCPVSGAALIELEHGITADNVNYALLENIVGLGYQLRRHSQRFRRTLQALVLLNYQLGLDLLHRAAVEEMYSEENGIHADNQTLGLLSELVLELEIPRHFYAAWLAEKVIREGTGFKPELCALVGQEPQALSAAMEISTGAELMLLGQCYWGHGLDSQNPIEELSSALTITKGLDYQQAHSTYLAFYQELFAEIIGGQCWPPEFEAKLKAYLDGELAYEQLGDKLLKKLKKLEVTTQEYEKFSYLYWQNGFSPLYKLILQLSIESGWYLPVIRILQEFFESGSGYEEFFHQTLSLGLNHHALSLFTAEVAEDYEYIHIKGSSIQSYYLEILTYGKVRNWVQDACQGLIRQYPLQFAGVIGRCTWPAKAGLLETLYAYDYVQYTPLLLEALRDKSKNVQNRALKVLRTGPLDVSQVIPLLSASSAEQRQNAIQILVSAVDKPEVKDAFRQTYLKEKDLGVQNLLLNELVKNGLSPAECGAVEPSSGPEILKYCHERLSGLRQAHLTWLDWTGIASLPETDWERELIRYILICYELAGDISYSVEAYRAARWLPGNKLAIAAEEVLNSWIAPGADFKEKWVLAFAALSGNFRVYKLLKKQIDFWANNSRGALACEAVRALALVGGIGAKENNEDALAALLIVDGLARNHKKRQIKEAAAHALAEVARQLGLEVEQLEDLTVPDLGFNRKGEKALNLGNQVVTLTLTSNLQLEIISAEGKKLKSLPGGSKGGEALEVSRQEFNLLKKQLKEIAASQKTRLEAALSAKRVWSPAEWDKLFRRNPLMQQFACSLIWGFYNQDQIIQTFRCLQDGSLTNWDDEEVQMPSQAKDDLLPMDVSTEGSLAMDVNTDEKIKIGLVHPLELTAELLSAWQTHFADYELLQPFEQLNRTVYLPTTAETTAKQCLRFQGRNVSGYQLVGALSRAGWYKDDILDGGCYYGFYREYPRHNMGVQLNMEGISIGLEHEETQLKDLIFYRLDQVERNTYRYASAIKEENQIPIGQVPTRMFSEVIRDLVQGVGLKEEG